MKMKNNPSEKNKKYLPYALALSFLIAVVISYFSFNNYSAQAAPNSTVYFDPATLPVNNNGTFSLDAKINPGTNQIAAVELHISFDQTKVRLNSISPSALFYDVLTPASIDNATGNASITLGTGSGTTYVTSLTTMATFSFTAIGNGTANVNFLNTTLAADPNEGANVITTRNGAVINIGAKTYSLADFQNIAIHWLQSLSGESNGDYNSDSIVNTRDIGIIMHSWQ
jgi:hypothetical protein